MNRQARILLVDDEKRFAESLQVILEHYDHQCRLAYSGREAIECLRSDHYDIALLDVGLPDISGCRVARFIQEGYQHTVVIMLTGLNTVETAVEAMKNGAYDFLNKPVDPERLLRTIAKAQEHKLLKRELVTSEKRFRTLAEATCEGIIFFAGDDLLEANEQFYTLFKYRRQDLPCRNFLKKLFRPSSYARIQANLEGDTPRSFEIEGLRSDGKTIYIQAKVRSTEFMGRSAYVMTMHDISLRIKHEKEKLALEKQLAQASKLNALGLMAGAVAHDLNNILTAVVSYPDLLMRQMGVQHEYYEEIRKIQNAGKQAAAIVSDLVAVARGGVRKKSVANINSLICDYLDSLEHGERLKTHADVEIQTSLQEGLANTECSPAHIRKVLLNLVGNAMESAGTGGIVRIKTEDCRISKSVKTDLYVLPAGDYVKLMVSDNGPGIAPEQIEHIFNPFYTTKETSKAGTGLGLTIVWNVVKEHRGWVDVEHLDPGVAFIVYLPATERAIASQASALIQSSLKGNGQEVLIVDDQTDQNVVMTKMLNMLGYRSHAVGSGEEAVAYLRDHKADLVILDMLMGDGLNGWQTYEQILQLHPDQKAIVVSGYCCTEEIEKAKELGITTFIEKPVSFRSLGVAIQGTLLQN